MAIRGRLPTRVVAAFPAEGAAMNALRLVGAPIQPRRLTREPKTRGRVPHDASEHLVDVRSLVRRVQATSTSKHGSECGCGNH